LVLRRFVSHIPLYRFLPHRRCCRFCGSASCLCRSAVRCLCLRLPAVLLLSAFCVFVFSFSFTPASPVVHLPLPVLPLRLRLPFSPAWNFLPAAPACCRFCCCLRWFCRSFSAWQLCVATVSAWFCAGSSRWISQVTVYLLDHLPCCRLPPAFLLWFTRLPFCRPLPFGYLQCCALPAAPPPPIAFCCLPYAVTCVTVRFPAVTVSAHCDSAFLPFCLPALRFTACRTSGACLPLPLRLPLPFLPAAVPLPPQVTCRLLGATSYACLRVLHAACRGYCGCLLHLARFLEHGSVPFCQFLPPAS